MEIIETFHPNGRLASRKYKMNGKSYREDGPAFEAWYDNGQPEYCLYRSNNRTQRKGGPCWQAWSRSGRLIQENYDEGSGLHRIGGPARRRLNYNGVYEEVWREDGQLHRVDGPAYSGGREVQWWLRDKCYGYGDRPSKEFCDKILPPDVRQALRVLPLPICDAIAEQFCAV